MQAAFVKLDLSDTFANKSEKTWITKKLLLSLAATFVLAIALTSCNTNSPKAAADKFLTSLYQHGL